MPTDLHCREVWIADGTGKLVDNFAQNRYATEYLVFAETVNFSYTKSCRQGQTQTGNFL